MFRARWLLVGCLVAAAGLARDVPRPDFVGITHWLNTPAPIHRESLQGKVVLVDFWTYSCINCIRAFPYLKDWYQKYHDQGLEIIAIHTPEFHFEKDVANVQGAIRKFALPYPVAMDDNYQTWDAFGSRNWPSNYLMDIHGNLRYRHFGEGSYAETEKEIQALLAEASPRFVHRAINSPPTVDLGRIKTAEIFIGLSRLNAIGNTETIRPGTITEFKGIAGRPHKHKVYLVGRWRMANEYAELASDNGRVIIRFEANKSNMVLANPSGQASIAEVFIDGAPAQEKNKGDDVILEGGSARATLQAPRMYNFSIGDYGEHEMELRLRGAGLRLYTITFG